MGFTGIEPVIQKKNSFLNIPETPYFFFEQF
jgi:hypothetical protein